MSIVEQGKVVKLVEGLPLELAEAMLDDFREKLRVILAHGHSLLKDLTQIILGLGQKLLLPMTTEPLGQLNVEFMQLLFFIVQIITCP